VFHDDQHSTPSLPPPAINAARVLDATSEIQAVNGAGAASIACMELLAI
jgi:malic enzyme